MARKNLRNISNPFGKSKNGIDMHLYSAVKEVQNEIIKMDMELRDKAGQLVIDTTKRKLASGGGDVPQEHRGSFTAGLKKRTRRFYTDVGVGKPGFHAFNVEMGHDVIRNGVKVGEAKPHPFLRPSFEEAQPAIIAILSGQRVQND
jgi:hypothetical protein